MRADRLRARDFRNIESCDISLCDGVNLLIGDNAQGKTNAVEALYMFARGRSFRFASDKDMVRFGKEGFYICLDYTDRHRSQRLEYSFLPQRRIRKINGGEAERVTDMLGRFHAVMFSPDHLRLVKGNPDERRSFINIAIAGIDNAYLKEYSEFQKILENRNALLKCASKGQYYDTEELDIWTEKMSDICAVIHSKRKKYISSLLKYAPVFMDEISESREKLTLEYESEIEGDTVSELRECYRHTYRELSRRECAAGCSLAGVHRDDLVLEIDGIPARKYASQGQQRSIVLALKLAEGEVSGEICGEYPVYLFDDVLSELDDRRKKYVLSGSEGKQFIITSCDELKKSNIHRIEVKGGTYVSAYRQRGDALL